jgi:anti-sigma B factor antagonist
LDQDTTFGIVQAKHNSGLRMVRPEGDLDIASAPQLRQFVERLWHDGVDRVFIDLSRVAFIDSRGLGVLVDLERDASRTDRSLAMGGEPPNITRLFQISGVVHILKLEDVPAYEPPVGAA